MAKPRPQACAVPPPPTDGPKDLIGPRGLAWLLERVADFGPEDPPWRRGPPIWRSEPQPPPLQLLVPETVALDAESRLPAGAFFTDSGGFLRGLRRSVRQDPDAFFEAITQLMRTRQQAEWEFDASKEDDDSPASQSVSIVAPLSSSHSPVHGASPSGILDGSVDKRKLSVRGSLGGSSSRRRARRSTFLGVSGRGNSPKHFPATGSWRLLFGSGAEERLSDSEVSQRLAAAGDARCSRWPLGARLVQATFWLDGLDGSRCLGVRETAQYHYEALQGEAAGNNPEALHQIMTNHFERFRHLDGVSDRARISALPTLLSQHLSYQSGLELVSGDFEFERDCHGQLWLTDVKDLYFISSAPRTGTAGGSESAGEQPPPLKMFRYLSEEALNNMPLADDTGQKCRHMLDLMREHYHGIRNRYDVDSLLKKRQDALEVHVPLLVGTDRKALARTFGLGGGRGAGAPRAASARGAGGGGHRYPMTPRARGVGGPAPPARPQRAGPGAASPRCRQLPAGVRERAAGARRGAQTPETLRRGSTGIGRALSDSIGRPMGTHAPNIEIVATAEAQRLVVGCGPGTRPKGPTLDSLVALAEQTPGAGLQEKRRSAEPTPRLVEVPPGAAAAMLEASRAASRQVRSGAAAAAGEREAA